MTTSPRRWRPGRKLPLDKVREAARGRVWSGADAQAHGLVDSWAASGRRRGRRPAGGACPAGMVFRVYPRPTGILGRLGALSGGLDASLGVLGRIESLLNLPALQAVLGQVSSLPQGGPGASGAAGAAHLPAALSCRSGRCKETACPQGFLNYNFAVRGHEAGLAGHHNCDYGALRFRGGSETKEA